MPSKKITLVRCLCAVHANQRQVGETDKDKAESIGYQVHMEAYIHQQKCTEPCYVFYNASEV